jgi:hypothetical protein
MNFSDKQHEPAGFIFHGATELDPEDACKAEVLDALAEWDRRPNHDSPGVDLLQLDGCPHFLISHDGQARNYWPSRSENDISETLIREFLYHDGICRLVDDRAHLFHVKYRMLSMTEADCLLVCPYLTDSGHISGIVVVLVTKKIREAMLRAGGSARAKASTKH